MAIIIRTVNDRYEFYTEDIWTDYDTGNMRMRNVPIGSATRQTDDEGYSWFEGRFDTFSISFLDNSGLEDVIKKLKPHEEVYFI